MGKTNWLASWTVMQYQYNVTPFPKEAVVRLTNFAKITFRKPPLYCLYWRSILPCPPYLPPPVGLWRSIARCPLPKQFITSRTALHNHACRPVVAAPIMYFKGAILPTSLSLKWQLSDLASLYVMPVRRRVDEIFLLLPIPVVSFVLSI